MIKYFRALLLYVVSRLKPRQVTKCLGLSDDIKMQYQWNQVTGLNIWTGYPDEGGRNFDMPEDANRLGVVEFDEVPKQLWIYYARSKPDRYYVMAFANMEPFPRENGQNWGVHPCVALEISEKWRYLVTFSIQGSAVPDNLWKIMV